MKIEQRNTKQREARNRQLERDRERLLTIREKLKPVNMILGQLKAEDKPNKTIK